VATASRTSTTVSPSITTVLVPIMARLANLK
jgi:hypothetical protein